MIEPSPRIVFYLPDTSTKLRLQGISERSNANGTSAAARLSTQKSGDGHGGFISRRQVRKTGIFDGGVLSAERRGLHLASAGVLSSREVKGQSEERHPRTELDVVGRRFSLRQNKDMGKK